MKKDKCLECGKEYVAVKFECLCPACQANYDMQLREELARREKVKQSIPRDEKGNFVVSCGTCGCTMAAVILEGPYTCEACRAEYEKELAALSKKRQAEEQAKVDFACQMD